MIVVASRGRILPSKSWNLWCIGG